MLKSTRMLILLVTASVVSVSAVLATPFTDAVRNGDSAALDSLFSLPDAAKQMNRKDDKGSAPLHYAVQLDRRSELSALVNHGADLEVPDSYGRTPLLLAVGKGAADVCGFLLRHGASVSAADNSGLRALHYAVTSAPAATLDTLLLSGVNLDAQDNLGRSALSLAILWGRTDNAERLLHSGANVNLRDKRGLSPLHHAVMQGDAEMVNFLLDQFADLNQVSGGGLSDPAMLEATPLHLAVVCGRLDLVELLLGRGASSSIANGNGDTPLLLAIRQAPASLVDRMLVLGASQANPGGKTTPLSLAMERGDLALIGRLIDNGASLNTALPSGNLPILDAVQAGRVDLVEVLLARGALPDSTAGKIFPLEAALDRQDVGIAERLLDAGADPNRIYAAWASSAFSRSAPRTPLSIAVKLNNLSLTRELLDHGAEVNLKVSGWDQTLLEQATGGADLPLVRLLVAEGAQIEPRTSPSEDAAGLALHRGYPFLRELLQAPGFNPGATDRDGNTYLHLATNEVDDERLIALVAAAGVELNRSDADGETALHDAARRNKPALTRALLRLGADPSLRDNKGLTALDVARGDAKAVLLLR